MTFKVKLFFLASHVALFIILRQKLGKSRGRSRRENAHLKTNDDGSNSTCISFRNV